MFNIFRDFDWSYNCVTNGKKQYRFFSLGSGNINLRCKFPLKPRYLQKAKNLFDKMQKAESIYVGKRIEFEEYLKKHRDEKIK